MIRQLKKSGKKSESWLEKNRESDIAENLLYLSEIIRSELISSNHDNLLAIYIEINKTKDLIA